jgi:2-octaprenylphenol hydroxylase
MRRAHDIVIAGGGTIGLATAALLATGRYASAFRIILIDAGPFPARPQAQEIPLRVSALSPASSAVLDRVGAWTSIAAGPCQAYDRMRVWDASASPDGAATLRFDADEFGIPHLGYIAANEQVRAALLDVLASTAVELRFDAPIDALDDARERPRLALGDGTRLDADLVIAADGANSFIRDAAGIGLRSHAYSQTAFVTHVECERPHRDTAWQRFLPSGPIGLLPLADGRASIVWTTTAEQAAAALDADEPALGAMLTETADGVLGEMTVAGPRGSFPLAARHATEYVRAGIALVGDAAHTVHPLAGQGANLGLADASALVGVLEAAVADGGYPGDRPVLRRYERQRRAENAAMMAFLTGLNRLYASDSALVGEIRKAGMALFNRSGPIREKVVGVALGERPHGEPGPASATQ